MLSVSQSAELLHVSASRIRALISQGLLPAEKVGRVWILDEKNVLNRLKSHPKPGRPHKMSTTSQSIQTNMSEHSDMSSQKIDSEKTNQQNKRKHDLYLACKNEFHFRPNIQDFMRASTSEEIDFYIVVADFFLQQCQKELINKGTF